MQARGDVFCMCYIMIDDKVWQCAAVRVSIAVGARKCRSSTGGAAVAICKRAS